MSDTVPDATEPLFKWTEVSTNKAWNDLVVALYGLRPSRSVFEAEMGNHSRAAARARRQSPRLQLP